MTTSTALRFDATVPRQEVHKRAVEEVLITDATALGADAYACAAHLPRSHRTYAPRGARRYELALLSEVLRQATIVVAHRHLGVPGDRQFLAKTATLEITDLNACRVRSAPARAVVEVHVSTRRDAGGALAAFGSRLQLSIEGVPVASADVETLCLARSDYQGLRDGADAVVSDTLRTVANATPAAPEDVGCTDPADVLVGSLERPDEGGAQAVVLVDPDHPSFFDHPLDHASAMLLGAASTQVAHAALGAPSTRSVPVASRARYVSPAELTSDIVCHAHVSAAAMRDRSLVAVTIVQADRVAVESELEFVRDDEAP